MRLPRPRKSTRDTIIEIAKGCCEYCLSQVAFSPDPFAIEHIEPIALGGTNELSNLAYACGGCNGKKYTHVTAYDFVTGQIVPLYHPRRDNWHEHFVWQGDFMRIVGITPSGRATVNLLEVNRQGVVNLRRAVRAIGEHPPDY